MLRADKVKIVEEMEQHYAAHPHVFLTSFRGLSANQSTELRRKVREIGGNFRVIKNRLAKRAAESSGLKLISDEFSGPCAVAAHESDPVALAKVLTDFAKDNPQMAVFAGVVDAQQKLDESAVKHLASLPGLPELRAQILAMINTPATTLVRLIGTPGTQVARVIDAKREKDGGEGEG